MKKKTMTKLSHSRSEKLREMMKERVDFQHEVKNLYDVLFINNQHQVLSVKYSATKVIVVNPHIKFNEFVKNMNSETAEDIKEIINAIESTQDQFAYDSLHYDIESEETSFLPWQFPPALV